MKIKLSKHAISALKHIHDTGNHGYLIALRSVDGRALRPLFRYNLVDVRPSPEGARAYINGLGEEVFAKEFGHGV